VAAVPCEPIDSVDFGYGLYTVSCLTCTTYTWNGEDGINREYVRHLCARPPLQSTLLRVGTPQRGCVMQGKDERGSEEQEANAEDRLSQAIIHDLAGSPRA
jgi:hypothetical protein